MKNGVPFELAFGNADRLTLIERTAISIKLSEFEGNKFNYDSFEFEKPPESK